MPDGRLAHFRHRWKQRRVVLEDRAAAFDEKKRVLVGSTGSAPARNPCALSPPPRPLQVGGEPGNGAPSTVMLYPLLMAVLPLPVRP
jgi:hypothetical protein